jgi:hypothetical protein
MDFTTQTPAESTEVNIFMIIMVVAFFIANFAFCRYMSIQIIAAGFVRKHPLVKVVNSKGKMRDVVNTKETTEEFKRLFFFWFVPGLGALSLVVLYLSGMGVLIYRRAKRNLFLNHL